MKRKIISMAMAAVVVMAGMTGCGDNKADTDNVEDVINSMDEKDVESAIIDNAEKIDAENNEEEFSAVEEQTKEVVYAPTDEIMNAELNSGLIQINNDVFQLGGYITVDEFVNKYSDRYDFEYMDGTYEERKDYLLEYTGEPFKKKSMSSFYNYQTYEMVLTPKYGNSEHKISVYVCNLTNPNEKITLDKGIVVMCEPSDNDIAPSDHKVQPPIWTVLGFSSKFYGRGLWEEIEGLESSDEKYDVQSLKALLEAKGYAENTDNSMFLTDIIDKCYTVNSNSICLFVSGKPNLAGEQPIYSCVFNFDTNTDKITDMQYSIYEEYLSFIVAASNGLN